MNAVITALLGADGLTAAKMYAVLVDLVPFVVFIVPIALGTYFFRRLIKGAGKGKIRV